MESLGKHFEKLAPFIKDPTLFVTLEELLEKDEKKNQSISVEEHRAKYQLLQTASEILADQELENIFEREGSLRHPPMRIKRIKQDPCLSEKSQTYPLLKAIENVDTSIASIIATKINSIIIAAVIASHSKSENTVYRSKIGMSYQAARENICTFSVDAFDTELIAFDLHKLHRFTENQGLEKDPEVDTQKLKAQNDAVVALMKSRQDYAVADCEFEADILDKVVVTFSPLKDKTRAALADVMLQDPEKAERTLQSDKALESKEFAALPAPMQALAKKLLAEQRETPKNKIVKVPTSLVGLLESLIRKFRPELSFDPGHFARMGRALFEEEPSEFIVSVDLNGELISFDETLDSNAAQKQQKTKCYITDKLIELQAMVKQAPFWVVS